MDSLSAGVQSLSMAHPWTKDADTSHNSKDSQGAMLNPEGTSLSVSDKESASIDERSVQLRPQPEIKQSEPITVLSVSQAVIKGDLKYIDEAYNKGFDFNIMDEAGKTLLDLAIEHNKTQIVAAFLGKYPHESLMHDQDILPSTSQLRSTSLDPLISPGKPNGRHIYPLYAAVMQQNHDIVHLLCSVGYLNLSSIENRSSTALHLAVFIQDEKSVQILLSFGASLNVQDNNLETPYMLSIRHTGSDSINIQKMLKDQPCDLNLKDKHGSNILMHSILKGSKKTFEHLMERAAEINLNAQDYAGNTAVHYAARKGDHRYLEALFNAQADGSIKNNVGRLPTYFVFGIDARNYVSHVKCNLLLLLNSYFNRHVIACQKLCAFSTQSFLQDQSILANYLLAYDNKGETIFSLAFDLKQDTKKELFAWLVSQVKPSLQDALGNSLYHYAVRAHRYELIKSMLAIQNNPFLNMQNQSGETPLHMAARNDFPRIAEALLPVSDVNCQDAYGRTTLMSALFYGNETTALCILSNSNPLDFYVQDIQGNTIIHLVNMHNHFRSTLINPILLAAHELDSRYLEIQNNQRQSIRQALHSLEEKVSKMPQESVNYFTQPCQAVPSMVPDSEFTYCDPGAVRPFHPVLYPSPVQQPSRFVQPHGGLVAPYPYGSPRLAYLLHPSLPVCRSGAPIGYLMRAPVGVPMVPPNIFPLPFQPQPQLQFQSNPLQQPDY